MPDNKVEPFQGSFSVAVFAITGFHPVLFTRWNKNNVIYIVLIDIIPRSELFIPFGDVTFRKCFEYLALQFVLVGDIGITMWWWHQSAFLAPQKYWTSSILSGKRYPA